MKNKTDFKKDLVPQRIKNDKIGWNDMSSLNQIQIIIIIIIIIIAIAFEQV